MTITSSAAGAEDVDCDQKGDGVESPGSFANEVARSVLEYFVMFITVILDTVPAVLSVAIASSHRAVQLASQQSAKEVMFHSTIIVFFRLIRGILTSFPGSVLRILDSDRLLSVLHLTVERSQSTSRIILSLNGLLLLLIYLLHRLTISVSMNTGKVLSKREVAHVPQLSRQYLRVCSLILATSIAYLGSKFYALAYLLSSVAVPCFLLVVCNTARALVLDKLCIFSGIVVLSSLTVSTVAPSLRAVLLYILNYLFALLQGSAERIVLLGGGFANCSWTFVSPLVLLYGIAISCARLSNFSRQQTID